MAMAGDDLEATVVRKIDELRTAIEKRPSMPPWVMGLVIFLVTQLIGGVWWAATIQARQEFLVLKVDEDSGRITVLEMRANKNDTDFGERVRAKVRETIDDLDLIRVRRKGEE